MTHPGRYDAGSHPENQFEPGSRGRVLRNRLGIRSRRMMDRVETEYLLQALHQLIDTYHRDHRFTAEDIQHIHRVWLADIYPWAGQYRTVNLSRPGITFAAAPHIPRLMEELEAGPLRQFTPCRPGTAESVARGLAVVHTELVLIHPFREGNGRTARLLSVLMALQADLPPLDFSPIGKAKDRQAYFAAVQAGFRKDYMPMATVFRRVIAATQPSG